MERINLNLNKRGLILTKEVETNLKVLKEKLLILQSAFRRQLIVTSGYRTKEEQIKIYERLRKAPKLNSQHLSGNAADVADPNGILWRFLMRNLKLVEDLGLYLEDKKYTPTWVHIQTVPPESKKRIFIP